MTRHRPPTLRFGPTTTRQGFTSYNTASFSDLRPVPIVRELIQNALDAAVEADEARAVVHFKVTGIRSRDIPDIDGYEKAFREAVDDQTQTSGELSDASKQVVNTIAGALHDLSTDGYWCLSVLDNGIGLDAKRLNALLGDGTGFKASVAAGSYGVGHFASVPASDLRYVLYGGVQKSGRRAAAGCATLASRDNRGGDHPLSAQGYLVDGFRSGRDGIYNFMTATSIPAVINDRLTEIKTQWKHGSAVVIPAFNYFGDDRERPLWDIVSKISAYNFNAAIQHDRLVVEVDEDDILDDANKVGVQRLDAHSIRGILELESEKSERSARKGSFFEGLRPSGRHAHSAYQTLEKGDRHRVATSAGIVDVRLLQPAPTGNIRVDLYRNGMWITDNVFGLRRADFADRPPFHAVLLLDASADNQFHRLVRKAEGPMHNELGLKRLAKKERETLKEALQDTAEWIKSEIPEVSTQDYSPDDFLAVKTGGHEPGGSTKSYAMWGAPVVVGAAGAARERVVAPGPSTRGDQPPRRGPSHTPRSRTNRTAGASLSFRSTVVPDGRGRHIIALEWTESMTDALLSLRVDENTDVTCDRIWPDEYVPLKSFSMAGAGSVVGRLTEDGRSIRLSGLAAGSVHQLTVEHAMPEELAGAVQVPAFRVELRRPLPVGNEDADED